MNIFLIFFKEITHFTKNLLKFYYICRKPNFITLMYIFNLTTAVSPEIHQQWLQWMKENYIPKVLSTGKVYNIRLYKVLDTGNDHNYAVQHQSDSPKKMMEFITVDVPKLQQYIAEAYGEKVLTFATQLKEITL